MGTPRYTEEFKVEAVRQVLDRVTITVAPVSKNGPLWVINRAEAGAAVRA